jgi:two-component system sensor histidine kinase KdpD
VINVDVTVEELRNRLREGKIHRPEKVEQALSNFFRNGNLTPKPCSRTSAWPRVSARRSSESRRSFRRRG